MSFYNNYVENTEVPSNITLTPTTLQWIIQTTELHGHHPTTILQDTL